MLLKKSLLFLCLTLAVLVFVACGAEDYDEPLEDGFDLYEAYAYDEEYEEYEPYTAYITNEVQIVQTVYAPQASRDEQWMEDIEYFAEALKTHPQKFR